MEDHGDWWNKIPAKIYFCVSGMEEEDMWFEIESSHWSVTKPYGYGRIDESMKQSLPSLQLTLAPHIEEPTFTPLGSIIYASGGYDLSPDAIPNNDGFYPSRKVFYVDTRRPEEGWKAAAPMIMKRACHYMLADSGKIYVLGGLSDQYTPVSTDNKKLFGEVYDPNSNSWEELARLGEDKMASIPQENISGHAVVASGVLDKKILFHRNSTEGLFYISTTRKDDVGCYDESFGEHLPPSAFLDNVLYFFSKKYIYAYDVFTCDRFRKVVLSDVKSNTLPVRGLDEGKPITSLIALGSGYLALIWAPDLEFQFRLPVHCSIIEMSRVGKTFTGKVLGRLTFFVENGSLKGGFAVLSTNVDSEADLVEKTKSSDVELGKKDRLRKRKFDEALQTDSRKRICK